MKNIFQCISSSTGSGVWKGIRAIASMLSVIALLTSCAATGPKFNGIAETVSDQGDVYLYRTTALVAGGTSFDIFIDDKPVDSLYSGSYLHLRLMPGKHTLKVVPGIMAKASKLTITVEAGKTNFYQYEFVTGILYNAFFIGSSIQPREKLVALEALKELQAAK